MASLIPTFEDIRKKNRENALNAQSKTNYWSNIDNRPNSQTQSNTLKTLASLNNDRANSAVNVVRNTFTNDNSQKTPSYDLNRSAVGGLRDNDSNFSYFTNKSFKSVLGDNADTSKMTYRNLVDTYNNASGDQQADIKKAISDEIITQRDYAKNGQQGSLKVIDYLNDLNSTLEKHGNTKGKSLLRQIGDYAATGGIVNTLGRGVSELVNNIGGAIFGQEAGDKARANLEKMDNSRKDLGAVGVADTALATAANYGANLGTGGLWGLANAGIGGANAVANTINDKTLAYDDNGNAIIRHKTDLEKAGELGNAALDAAFAIAGKKGIGPTLEATGKNAATGLAKLSAKDLAKYAVKELPWAGATTYLQQGLSNISQGKDWGNMDTGEFTKDFLLNLGQDVGMDAANYGAGKLAQRNAIKNGIITQDINGNLIKRDKNWNIDDVTNEDLSEIAKKAVSQNTISNKALKKVNENTLLNELAKNSDLRNQIIDNVDDTLTDRLNFSRRTEMANAIKNGVDNDMNGTYMRQKAFDDANSVRKAEGKTHYDSRQTKLYAERTGEYDSKSIKGHYLKHANELRDMEGVIDVMERSINGANSQAYPTKKNENTVFASETANQGYYPASTVIDKDLGILGITARDYDQIEKYKRQKSSLGSGTKSTITSTSDAAGFPFSGPQTTSRGSGGRSTSTILSSSEDDLAGAPISGRRASDSSSDGGTSSSSQQVTPEAGFPLSGRRTTTSTIPQNSEPVNRGIEAVGQEKYDALQAKLRERQQARNTQDLPITFETTKERNKKYDKAIKDYYKKYGDDFEEHLPLPLLDRYSELLNKAPRDENDVYTDPITGGKGIDTVIKGGVPDGSNLVKTDYNLPKDATPSDVARAIRKTIRERFQGNSYQVGDTGINADVTRRTREELRFQQSNMTDADFIKKGSLVGNYDELLENMTNIREVPNRKPEQKPNVDHYLSGRVAVDFGDGNIYHPRIDVEINKQGRAIGYDIADIKEFPQVPSGRPTPMPEETNSRNSIIPQKPSEQERRARLLGSLDEYKQNSSVTNDVNNITTKSKFAENTSTNKNFSEETRKALKTDPIGYKPTTNEERLARANQILGTKSIDEVDNYLRDNFFNVKDKERNSGDVVLAGELSKLLDAKGQYDRSTEIINKMSSIASKQGQDIQALSLMMNRSPEGIANMAQSAIKKGGGQMTGELRGEIVNKAQEIGKIRSKNAALSEENAKITEQIMAGKGDLSSLRKRQMEIMRENRLNTDAEARQFSQIDDIVSKNTPDNRSVFGSVYRASLLSGPRTHTGNLVSNITQNTLDAVTDRIASGIDLARSKITGKEREIVASAGGRKEGLKRGLKAAAEVMKTGDNLWDGMDANINKVNAWGQGGELEFKNKIANTMVAKPTNTVFRAMSAGDLPFRYTAFENAIRTEAKRQGVNLGYKGQMLQDYVNSRVAAPDPELQAYGIRKGNESVYDADTLLSKGMNAVDRVINSIDNPVGKKAAQTAKTLIAPFVKVPSKVLSTAIDYSPLGTVQALVKKIGSKNYTTAKFETDLARSGFGTTALVGLGYALSAAGLLTGGYPDDQTERNRWKAEGIEPNSVKIGDKYVSLNYLGPMAMLTAMGAGVQQRIAKGEDAWSVASGTVMDTLNSFLDQSYVQGLNNAVQAITDSQRYGESYLNSLARGLTPNLLRQTATATDSKQRQVNNPGEAIISGIPGLSQTLDAKVDTYGREIENKQTLPLGQMWDALKISNSRETNDVIDEVSRLHGIDPNNADYQITPTAQQGSISVNGTNVKLTDKQKTQLQKDTGEAALVAMAQVMKSSEYAGLTDDAKAAALKKAQKDAQKQARKQFIEANNISAENNLGTTNSGGKVTEDYTAKAISSATSNGERKNGIKISDSLSGEHKSVLEKYNSMSSEDWEKYVYGNSPESATAEYSLAKAKYENDLAKGELTDVQKIKRQKELAKLEVSRKWTKDVRDVYSLAGTKADIQELLDGLDSETREKMVGMLNGLNNAMYEAGAISTSTYNSRGRNINNLIASGKSSGSKSSGISSAEASALKSATKALSNNAIGYEVKTLGKPTTSRQMAKTALKQTATKSYTPKKATISVKKGK